MRYRPRHSRKKRSRGWLITLGLVFGCALCWAAFKLAQEVVQVHEERAGSADLSSVVAEAARQDSFETPTPHDDTPEPVAIPVRIVPAATEAATPLPTPAPTPLPEYAALYAKNPDFFAWIAIEGTNIDYPVMHSPDNPEYYLKRAFDGSESAGGTLFMDGSCPENGNIYLVYGHNMKNKTMFGQLPEYADRRFFEEYPTIRFDTLYERREYQVIAALYSRVYWKEEKDVFRYYAYTDLTDEEVFNEYVDQVRAVAIYDTGFTAEYGDELLALSTCNYHTENGRFVVVAKRISIIG